MSVNKAIIIGNLGRDPEPITTQTGMSMCALSVATSHRVKGEEETEWHRVTVFGKTADACMQYLQKGRSVYVEGRIQTRKYEKDGVTRYSTGIIAQEVKFMGGKGGGSSDAPAPYEAPKDDAIPF